MTQAELDELLRPPTEVEAERALAQFTADVRRHYGDRLKGLYLFGSRARGDHTVESDADVAVVLQDGDWEEWKERWKLAELAYGTEMGSGLSIQPWPFSEAQWLSREANLRLIESARRDAVPLLGGP